MKYLYILIALLGIIFGWVLTVEAAPSILPIFGGGTGSAGPFASSTVLVSNGTKFVGYATSSLGITATTPFGQAWEIISGYLTPTTTQTAKLNGGFISTASSTISGNLNISGNATATNATTTNLAVLTDAFTTNLTVSRALRLSALATGVLHSVSGVISSSLIDLVNDVTGVLGIANGGTNASALTATQLLWFNGTRLAGTSTPIASYFIATSTSLASIFPYASTTAISSATSFFIGNLDVTPKITTAFATPPYYHGSAFIDSVNDFGGSSGFASSTVGLHLFNLHHRMDLNQVSTYVVLNGLGTTTLDIGIYSESGVLLGQGTTNWPVCYPFSPGCTATTTAIISPTLSLAPGNYYVGYLTNATSTAAEVGNMSPYGFNWSYDGNEKYLLADYFGKNRFWGTTTAITKGVLPTSFNPVTMNSYSPSNFGLFLRLDN